MKPFEITEEKIYAFLLLSSPPLPEKASTLFDYIKKDDEVLEFERNLHIAGNIDNSFIFTKGELICDGNVSNSTVVAANGLNLKGGVKDSKLYSTKSMNLGTVNNSELFCLDSIYISTICRNSNLFVYNNLHSPDADFIDTNVISGGNIEIQRGLSETNGIKLVSDQVLTSDNYKGILNSLANRLEKTISKIILLIEDNITTDSSDLLLKKELLENQLDYISKKIKFIDSSVADSNLSNKIIIISGLSDGARIELNGISYTSESDLPGIIFEVEDSVLNFKEINSD